MYWLSTFPRESYFGVTDTLDNSTEVYSREQIDDFVSKGIKIQNYDILKQNSRSILAKLSLLVNKDYKLWVTPLGVCCDYTGDEKVVSIPRGVNCLNSVSGFVRELILPDTVWYIGTSCWNSNWLCRVVFPNRPFMIDHRAFKGCASLHTVDLSNCFYIGEEAFSRTGLDEVKSLGNIDVLSPRVFSGCKSLYSLPTSSSIKVIHGDCVQSSGVRALDVYSGVKIIAPQRFKARIKG